MPRQTLHRDATWRSDHSRSEGSSDEHTTPRARGTPAAGTPAAAYGEMRGENLARYAPRICMLDTGCVEAVVGEQ